MSLERILLTGASSALAGALLARLAQWEPRPALVAHYHSNPAPLAALRERLGPLLVEVKGDLAREEDTEDLIKTTRALWGHPEGIVLFPALPLRLVRYRDWDQDRFMTDWALQVGSAGLILRAFLGDMARSERRCKVVFVLSSVVHGLPPRFMAMYTVVKYAQLGLMRALASEYAGTGVCINAVSPAMVETRFLDELPGKAVALAGAQMPRGRNLVPAEVAGALAFLLGPESDAIHGMDLVVADGKVL